MPGLEGRLIVVTRALHQSQGFVQLLEDFGARVAHFPVIAIAPPADWAPVDEAIARFDLYQWLLFTSANAVDAFFGHRGPVPVKAQIAAVGPATAQALRKRGLPAHLVPPEHIAEGLIAAFAGQDLNGVRMLLPRAAAAREVLPHALRARGAIVDIVEVYRNALPVTSGEFPARPDWVTFTSASTVKNLLALVPRAQWECAKLASIGPQTSAALRLHRLNVTVEAAPSTQEALATAIAMWENSAQ